MPIASPETIDGDKVLTGLAVATKRTAKPRIPRLIPDQSDGAADVPARVSSRFHLEKCSKFIFLRRRYLLRRRYFYPYCTLPPKKVNTKKGCSIPVPDSRIPDPSSALLLPFSPAKELPPGRIILHEFFDFRPQPIRFREFRIVRFERQILLDRFRNP